MSAGDPFSTSERFALDETIRKAEQLSRVEFSVFVGAAEGDPRLSGGDARAGLEHLHQQVGGARLVGLL